MNYRLRVLVASGVDFVNTWGDFMLMCLCYVCMYVSTHKQVC